MAISGSAITDQDFLRAVRSTEYRTNPYPFLAQLRAQAPVHRTGDGIWLLTRYEDVARALRDATMSTDVGDPDGPRNLLLLDAPAHTRIRTLVNQAFTRQAVTQLTSRVEVLVDELLDAMEVSRPPVKDLVTDFAYPLPVQVICDLLGVPADDNAIFQEWSRLLGAGIDPDFLVTAEQRQASTTAAREFAVYFADLIERRRDDPADDLLTALIAAESDGDRLSQQELLTNGIFLIVSGHESTVNLIGNGMLGLLTQRRQHERLVEDSNLAAAAVEELLRYESPLQLTVRRTTEDWPVGGVVIPSGEQVMPLLGAANRDPAHFQDPDSIDIDREDARTHVAFGGGPHRCLGAQLARLVGAVALRRLTQRFPSMEVAGEPEHGDRFALRDLQSLPITLG